MFQVKTLKRIFILMLIFMDKDRQIGVCHCPPAQPMPGLLLSREIQSVEEEICGSLSLYPSYGKMNLKVDFFFVGSVVL